MPPADVRQKANQIPRGLSVFALAAAGVLTAIGTAWAFQRGGRDFDVFFHACSLVLGGKGSLVYSNSPDRYLYAPGFAWLFAPIALLPRDFALAIWCFAKAATIGWMIRALGLFLAPKNVIAGMGAAALGLILVARPMLIDFEYGQVNLFIVAACLWALLVHTGEDRGPTQSFLSWAVLAVAAIAKVFPLPLLIVPFLLTRGLPRERIDRERLGVVIGVAVALLVPAITEGLRGLPPLYAGWKIALLAKGLPLESHNQSFIAFLHHYASGRPTHVISQGWVPLRFGMPVFQSSQLTLISLAWTASSAGFLLAWLLRGPSADRARWVAAALAMLILPSHLVWKPYFVTGFPLAAWIVAGSNGVFFPLAVFAAINLTGFDFVGHDLAARLEAASILLFAQIALLIAAFFRR